MCLLLTHGREFEEPLLLLTEPRPCLNLSMTMESTVLAVDESSESSVIADVPDAWGRAISDKSARDCNSAEEVLKKTRQFSADDLKIIDFDWHILIYTLP